MTARPFVRWAGGKGRSVREITRRLPDHSWMHAEPFVGGGAVFFALASAGRVTNAILADANRELIETYKVVRDDVERLISVLRYHQARHSESYYYELRDEKPTADVETAARFLYLNRAGYNGLYRVNREGRFNVPWGKRARVDFDEENLRACSRVLQGANLIWSPFTRSAFVPGATVYYDPPYLGRFAGYTATPFSRDDHVTLARHAETLALNGVAVLVSNADTPEVRELYAGWSIAPLVVPSTVGAKNRGVAKELVATPPGGVITL